MSEGLTFRQELRNLEHSFIQARQKNMVLLKENQRLKGLLQQTSGQLSGVARQLQEAKAGLARTNEEKSYQRQIFQTKQFELEKERDQLELQNSRLSIDLLEQTKQSTQLKVQVRQLWLANEELKERLTESQLCRVDRSQNCGRTAFQSNQSQQKLTCTRSRVRKGPKKSKKTTETSCSAAVVVKPRKRQDLQKSYLRIRCRSQQFDQQSRLLQKLLSLKEQAAFAWGLYLFGEGRREARRQVRNRRFRLAVLCVQFLVRMRRRGGEGWRGVPRVRAGPRQGGKIRSLRG